MDLITWEETMSVNVQEIDKQHQGLINLINDLNKAMRERKTKEVLDEIISSLIDYTLTHFLTEEKYFEKFEYLSASAHKKEHNDFVNRVSEFKKNFDEGKMMLSIEIMDFLKDWLTNHIKGSDKKYGPFFNEKGLE